jgi:phosphate transport system protein
MGGCPLGFDLLPLNWSQSSSFLVRRVIFAEDSSVPRLFNVNRMDIDLEGICMQLLALHQPVAGDLRLITAVMKITTELERIGDRMVNICEAVHDRDERDPLSSHAEVSQMGALALAMVSGSLTAFSRADSSVAKRVFEKDNEFDALYCAVFAQLTSVAKDPDRVAHDTKLAFLSKDLNEISEHRPISPNW